MTGIEIGLLLAAIGGGAASGIGGSMSSREQTKASRDIAKMNNEADWKRQLLQTALAESMADPFRHQLAQSQALGRLDLQERADITPRSLTAAAPYAQYVPRMSGGFSYRASPELQRSAGALKQNVMAGNQAPTMTDAGNYGRTGILDLLAILAGQVPASSPYATATPRPRSPSNVVPGRDRKYADILGNAVPRY